jgi:molybdopterin/thiamine biosynthesis adenylyltransferase
LGSEIGEGLVRKGIGNLNIFDGDTVELSNLNRQKFYKKDLYKYKAVQLAKNLSKEGISATKINGFPHTLQEAIACNEYDLSCHVAVCGVDNNQSRVFAAELYYRLGIPVIFTAVNEEGNAGYVFVQEKGKACFGCFRPNAIDDKQTPCPGSPAIKDILKVVAGIVLYAVDSLFMERLRVWNYKEIFLDGTIPEFCTIIERKHDCKLCNS